MNSILVVILLFTMVGVFAFYTLRPFVITINDIFISDRNKIIAYLESHPEEQDGYRKGYFRAKGHEKYTPVSFVFAVICILIWMVTGNLLILFFSPALLCLFRLISAIKYRRYFVRFGFIHRDLQPKRFQAGIIGMEIYLVSIVILLIMKITSTL